MKMISIEWRFTLLALVTALCLSSPGQAHESGIATLTLDLKDSDRPTIAVELDVLDLEIAVGLDGNGDGEVLWREYQASTSEIEQYIQSALTLSVGSDTCTMLPMPTSGGVRQGAAPSVVTVFQLNCETPLTTLTVDNRLLSSVDPAATALLVVLGTGSEQSAALPLGKTTVAISNTSFWASFTSYIIVGFHHILSGADHLVFLLLLILPVARKESLKSQLISVAGIVTAFTVAHSMTLGLSATGYLVPPATTVEVIIAATVVMAALFNVIKPKHRISWIIAYCFGLVHGFGFASALSDLMVANGTRIANLAAFNIGVELGQIGFVLLVFPLLWLISRRAFYSRTVVAPLSLGIAVIGCFWMVERLS